MQSSSVRTNRRALALMVLVTLIWGTTWTLMPIAMREVSVWTFRAIATLAAGVVLLGVALLRGQSLKIRREDRGTVVAASIAYLVVWNLASAQASILIPSGQAAVLGFTMPFWVALLARIVFGERLGRAMVAAILLGATSIALLMLPNFGVYAQAPLGMVLGLVAGFGWAVGTLIIKRRPPVASATVLTGWQLMVSGALIAIGALLLGDGHWFMPSATSIAAIAWLALGPTALGNLCWFAIIGLLPANVASLSSILVPVIALVVGAIVHDEPFGAAQWIAMGCCVAALWLALGRGRVSS